MYKGLNVEYVISFSTEKQIKYMSRQKYYCSIVLWCSIFCTFCKKTSDSGKMRCDSGKRSKALDIALKTDPHSVLVIDSSDSR